jgi:predicted acyl esterase
VTAPHKILTVVALLGLGVTACSDSGPSTAVLSSAEPTATTAAAPEQTPAPTTTLERAPATFRVQPGTEQVAVLDAEPGTELVLMGLDGAGVAGTVDEQGALLFRNVAPGGGYTISSPTEQTARFAVAAPADHPDADWYAAQEPLPAGGFGYLTTRDGTTLSVNVVLPGPADGGPYPTVVEYSGYQPSDPDSAAFAQIYTALGFAYVGVNMRGTGCSGGSYRFFETVQSLDGYDVVETVAAQPWVRDAKVGMVGISYPGISQLFVAATTPPSLAAITPISVLDDSFRATLYPGGILNTGFAVDWTQQRVDEARPFGQGWTEARVEAGDTECEANQRLRLQNPDLVAEIGENPYYSVELGDPLAPITFVDRITVPVFLAGAWQDEQTGGHFPRMLDRFTGARDLFVTLVNGGHTESLSPAVFARYVEFLQLYVAEQVPDLTAANGVVPILASTLYGTDAVPADWPNRFTGLTYDAALAAFEAEPAVRVLLEQGAAEGWPAGSPVPRTTLEFDSWPVPEAVATSWALGAEGRLVVDPAAASGESSYTADPTALPPTFYSGGGSEIWRFDASYEWQPIPAETGLGFVTDPLDDDLLVVGPGSVDLWISADADDTDLEVTLTEVRPDGTEVYVQSGWLRASQRALDEAASTEVDPVQTHLEADAARLPPDEFTAVRVALFPVAHVFRAGSRLRLTIDAPGNNRPVWELDSISAGETVTVGHDATRPSRLVLSVVATVDGAALGPTPPACGALRAQPCRTWVAAANGG